MGSNPSPLQSLLHRLISLKIGFEPEFTGSRGNETDSQEHGRELHARTLASVYSSDSYNERVRVDIELARTDRTQPEAKLHPR